MNSMKEGSTHPLINGTIHKIKVISSRSFEIGDTREYSEYLKNGLAKNVKIPVKLNFRSFENTILSKEDIPFDHNLVATDYTRLSHNNLLHFCFIALSKFRDNKKALPSQWSSDDANIFIDLPRKRKDLLGFSHIHVKALFRPCVHSLVDMPHKKS
jgi:ubiquitin-activating enzyme E1